MVSPGERFDGWSKSAVQIETASHAYGKSNAYRTPVEDGRQRGMSVRLASVVSGLSLSEKCHAFGASAFK